MTAWIDLHVTKESIEQMTACAAGGQNLSDIAYLMAAESPLELPSGNDTFTKAGYSARFNDRYNGRSKYPDDIAGMKELPAATPIIAFEKSLLAGCGEYIKRLMGTCLEAVVKVVAGGIRAFNDSDTVRHTRVIILPPPH